MWLRSGILRVTSVWTPTDQYLGLLNSLGLLLAQGSSTGLPMQWFEDISSKSPRYQGFMALNL